MPASSEVIRFAGDVSIDKIEIISSNGFGQEVTNQVIALEIYEDIFSPFISGVLAFKDSVDFINLFPFVGEEFLNLKIHTPSFTGKDKTIEDQFYIFKLSNREMAGDRNMIYEVHFFSREAMVDLNKKVSKAFEGKISDIAKTIVSDTQHGLESKKKMNVEETPNGVKYISNFWSPVKNLNYVAENATNKNGAASYLFFENRNGFNFQSLEKLYKDDIIQDFTYDGWMRDFKADGSSIRNVEKEYKRIINISVPKLFDYIDRSTLGLFGSKLITFDITTKKYVVKNFSLQEDFDKEEHLNKHSLLSKKNIHRPNAMLISYTKYYNNFNNYGDVTNAKTIQKRTSQLQQADANAIEIVVPGRTDYTVGKKVYVKLNKFQPIDSKDTGVEDKVLSGNYLIASINHYVTRDSHECHMKLIKDTYIIDLDKGK